MADNGWMYSGRISATNKTDDWVQNTHLLVNELARFEGNGSGTLSLRSLH